MGNTPVVVVDETGIHAPDFATILSFFQDAYRGIYGADTYLEPDSQDGQFLGILAAAINDTNAMAVEVYNSFSPATAQGTGLSSVVKINGIARKVPSFSSADVLLVGQAGTIITNKLVGDDNGFRWALPASILIPYSGQILVTAICTTPGAITAPAGTINTPLEPSPGWQTATNPSDATPGEPVETDRDLRIRQALSTMIPANGLVQALVGSILALPGVTEMRAYENQSNIPDADGIPGHCYAFVIEGGDVQEIANTIQGQKGGGTGTYGNVVETVTDRFGVPHQVAFFRPTEVPITYKITLQSLAGFSTAIQAMIASAMSDWTNALGIGDDVRLTKSYVPANLSGLPASDTYEIISIAVARDGHVTGFTDVTIAFNEEAVCHPSFIQFVFTTP